MEGRVGFVQDSECQRFFVMAVGMTESLKECSCYACAGKYEMSLVHLAISFGNSGIV